MLTGRLAFPGETVSDAVAAILSREPDWLALPVETPESVRRLLRRSLEKDPKAPASRHRRRTNRARRDARSARRVRSSHVNGSARAHRRERCARRDARPAGLDRCGLSVAAIIAALALGRGGFFDRSAVDRPRLSFLDCAPRGDANPGRTAARRISARRDALPCRPTDAASRSWRDGVPPDCPLLWVRPLDAVVAQSLAGTEGATYPFWSPDSRFVAFLAQGKLKKIDVSGGAPLTLCDASLGATGAWNRDDVILFTPKGGAPLYRVSASGGTPSPVTTFDTASGDTQHWFPFFLPDGRHFLYSALGSRRAGATDPRGVYVGSLDPKEAEHAVAAGRIPCEICGGPPDLPARHHAHGAAVRRQPSRALMVRRSRSQNRCRRPARV